MVRQNQFCWIQISFVSVGGFVIRGCDGRFLQTGTFNLKAASVLVVEATPMRNGVRVAVQAGYRSVVLEGDN